MNRYLQASTRWYRAVLESRDNQLVTSTVVKLLQHWELKCYFKTEVTKIINYCVRGGHKPARWPWPTLRLTEMEK